MSKVTSLIYLFFDVIYEHDKVRMIGVEYLKYRYQFHFKYIFTTSRSNRFIL